MDTNLFYIVVIDPLPGQLRHLFEQQIPSERVHFACPKGSSEEELAGLVVGANALITRKRKVTADLIHRVGASLQLIQVMGRLADRVDLSAARERRIPVATMPHGGAQAVAEHAMALILALSRNLLCGHKGVVDGCYQKRGLEPAETSEFSFAFNWLGFSDVAELRAKTLGLIGFGEIGKEVAWRARAFDMRILYHQRNPVPDEFENLLSATWSPLEELLGESDFVSLHTPHTEQTEQLLSRDRLALMKPNAFLVNTARGAIVDELGLVECLREKRIAGAGLDVFVQEPLPHDHPLIGLDNVILAPHTGGGSGGGQRRHFEEILENISRVARGEEPHHRVLGERSTMR